MKENFSYPSVYFDVSGSSKQIKIELKLFVKRQHTQDWYKKNCGILIT